MPATIPYIAYDSVVLPANTSGSVLFTMGLTESMKVKKIWIVSTGEFSIYDIRDSAGFHYTNASSTDPIPSVMLWRPQTTGEGIGTFVVELEIKTNTTLYIDITDTSGASNTIRVALEGVKEFV